MSASNNGAVAATGGGGSVRDSSGVGSTGSSQQQDEDDEISPPLLVRIQTIDLQSLDFQTNIGSTAKFRNLTCIEATNLFLFVGSTSGTVYVFSRDTLKFLFIIPFKGGKVCSIACSQDESDIAVGSLRGKVSIYRISPNVHYMQSVASAPLIDAFRDIYDVPHHAGAEITELQWSPNGKYLFVGDSQGIVSQMDVACLDEFPRPVPSKVILKLHSRVLQIDCSFPYLAVCTLVAVFLCDLEKEDFTRVQCTKNTDIRSTGLCLMILPERSSLRDLAKERTIPSAKLMLFIGEVGSGTIHCCNMEGSIQHSKRIAVSEKVSKYSMPLFDPTKAASIPQNGQGDEDEDEEPVSISLGKMLCTDDGMIVSVSSDRLYVYDPYTLNVIAWNEDFKRINNFKIISNYAFVWAGSKLDVVAFTPFRSYAEQLYRAKLLGVLESWIVHTVYSLGWRRLLPALLPPLLPAADQQQAEEEGNAMGNCDQEKNSSSLVCVKNGDKNQQKAVSNFRKMLFSEGDEESEFTQFVADHVPFPILLKSGNPGESDGAAAPEELGIIMTSQEDVEEATLERPITTFLKDAQSIFAPLLAPSQIGSVSSENMSIYSTTATVNNDIGRISSTLSLMLKISEKTDFLQLFSQVWKSLLVFYEDIEVVLPQLDYKKSDLTLSHILHASSAFLQQPKLVNLHERIEQVGEMVKFEDIVIRLISCLYCPGSSYNFKKCSSSLLIDPQCPSNTNLFMLCFTKFTHCPLVIQWFRELGTSHETLFYDGLLADTLLLLFPLCSYKSDGLLLASCLDSIGIYDKLPKFFMTWLFLCRYLHKPKQVPYSPLLRSLLNAQLFEKLAEEMFSTIYRDFRLSSFGAAAHYLHHFVSALVLLSKSPDCGHPRNVSILISCFPLTKWAREDIVTKVIAACHLNPALLGLYLKACLEDGHSMKLCACGIQAGYGNLEEKIPAWQRAIEEAIIKLLLEEYFKSNPYDDENEEGNASVHDGNGNDTQKRRAEMLVHMFAMRRGLLEPYFRSPLPDEFLSEEVQAELIVRSGSCASLKYYQCNEQNMSLLLRSYQCHNFQRKHKNCTKDHDGRMKVNGGGAGEKNSGVLNVARNSKDNKIQSKSSGHILTKCFKCNYPLKMFNRNFKPMSRDCLGMWALKQTGSLQGLIEIVQRSQLNVPSNFSARFYRTVVQYTARGRNNGSPHEYEADFGGEPAFLSCDAFH